MNLIYVKYSFWIDEAERRIWFLFKATRG